MESLICEKCGGSNSMPTGKVTMFCAFCGSMIESNKKEIISANQNAQKNLDREFELDLTVDVVSATIDFLLIIYKNKYQLKNSNKKTYSFTITNEPNNNVIYQVQLFVRDFQVVRKSIFDDKKYFDTEYKTKIQIKVLSESQAINLSNSADEFTNDLTQSLEYLNYFKVITRRYLFAIEDAIEAIFEIKIHFVEKSSSTQWDEYLRSLSKFKHYFDMYNQKEQKLKLEYQEMERVRSNKMGNIILSRDVRFKHFLYFLMPPVFPFIFIYFKPDYSLYTINIFIITMIASPCLFLFSEHGESDNDPLLRLIGFIQISIGAIALILKFI